MHLRDNGLRLNRIFITCEHSFRFSAFGQTERPSLSYFRHLNGTERWPFGETAHSRLVVNDPNAPWLSHKWATEKAIVLHHIPRMLGRKNAGVGHWKLLLVRIQKNDLLSGYLKCVTFMTILPSTKTSIPSSAGMSDGTVKSRPASKAYTNSKQRKDEIT